MGSLDRRLFPEGTLIEIEGVPFRLSHQETWMIGNKGDLSLISVEPLEAADPRKPERLTSDDESQEAEELVMKVLDMTESGELQWIVVGGSAFAALSGEISIAIADLRWVENVSEPPSPPLFESMPPMPPMRDLVDMLGMFPMNILNAGGKSISIDMSRQAAVRLSELLGPAFAEEDERRKEEERLGKQVSISDVLHLLEVAEK